MNPHTVHDKPQTSQLRPDGTTFPPVTPDPPPPPGWVDPLEGLEVEPQDLAGLDADEPPQDGPAGASGASAAAAAFDEAG